VSPPYPGALPLAVWMAPPWGWYGQPGSTNVIYPAGVTFQLPLPPGTPPAVWARVKPWVPPPGFSSRDPMRKCRSPGFARGRGRPEATLGTYAVPAPTGRNPYSQGQRLEHTRLQPQRGDIHIARG